MMRLIIGWSLQARFIVVALAAAMMFFGYRELRDSPVDVFPEFSQPKVEIQTPALGLSATEVEAYVTIPLEDSLNGIPNLEIMRSNSVEQLSQIELLFERGTDLVRARQLVNERITTVSPQLPTWTAPPFIMQPLSSTSRAMKVGLSSEEHSLIDLSMTSYWKIRPRLMEVPGVANVTIYGERIRMLTIQIDPERLNGTTVTLDQIKETVADSVDAGLLQFSDGGWIGTGGFVDTPNQRLWIEHVIPITTPEDLAEVPIKGSPEFVLGDVANLVEDHQALIGDAVVNDGDGILLIVEKFPWANTLDVTHGVEDAFEDLRPALSGIEIDTTIFRPATFIEDSIENLTWALVLGSLFVIVILILFLFEWRTALISVVAIPLSLMAAMLILDIRGTTINVMVLAGLVIAIGDVVDDAIIDIENIWRRLRQHRLAGTNVSTARIILDASIEVRGAIVHATLMDVVVLLPVFTLGGLSGAFFSPLALSYVLAILASMVVALTVTPAMALILFAKAPLHEPREPLVVRFLKVGYEKVLLQIIRRPQTAYLTVGLVVMTGLVVAPQLGQELLPSFKERDFLMHWLTKPGTSLPEEKRISVEACQELRDIPGVRNCGAHIGQALLADEPYGVYFGENWVSVDESVDYDETVAAIQETVDGYPGLYRDVQTYLKERIREVLTGSSEAIVVRIFGSDLHVLREKAAEVEEAMAEIEGITDLHMELQVDIPQLEVEVDLAKAQQYGIKPGDVRRASGIWVAGEEAGDIFRDGKAYDVHVWSLPESRNDVADISNLLVDTPSGEKVRIGDVAEIRISPIPNKVHRENQSRTIDVEANVLGRDLGSVSHDVDEALEEIEFPREYHAEQIGEFQERQESQRRLVIYGIAAALGVLVLLFLAFNNWRLAFLSFFTLPSALVGGVVAAYIGGGVLSLGSLVGFLTVFGIGARNGIMLITHFQHLETEEGEPFGPNLVLRGAKERLAPILMTALATGLAIIPLVYVGSVPGNEIEHPMAVVIFGGIITSTLLNLFIVPSLYLRFAKAWNLPLLNRRRRAPGSA
jgi:CzcA family heavy metal efflux pump